mgnify:CR=1 FL=1
MQIYGIIGYPLGHSCSPRYFNEKFQKENIAAELRNARHPAAFNTITTNARPLWF